MTRSRGSRDLMLVPVNVSQCLQETDRPADRAADQVTTRTTQEVRRGEESVSQELITGGMQVGVCGGQLLRFIGGTL